MTQVYLTYKIEKITVSSKSIPMTFWHHEEVGPFSTVDDAIEYAYLNKITEFATTRRVLRTKRSNHDTL